jgi:hypothetical protein
MTKVIESRESTHESADSYDEDEEYSSEEVTI